MRITHILSAPEGVAPGAPSGPAQAPPASGAAPAQAPPADIAAMVAEAMKAQIGPILADRDAALASAAEAKAALAAANQGVANTAAAKATAEEQIARLRSQFGESQSKQALALAVDRYQYASPAHRDAALVHFKAECAIKAEDSGEVVAQIGGKSKPVPAAFDEWFAAKGAIYKAAVAQPGPGQPPPAGLDASQPRKRFSEMSDAEFAAVRAQGVKGTLTDGRNAHVFEVRTAMNPYASRRAHMLDIVSGRNGQSSK